MSVGGDNCFTEPYSDMLFSVYRVSQGRFSFDSIEKFTEPFLQTLEREKNSIAGIVIEPLVQGAGGMIVWPKEALEIIGAKAKIYKIPIIFDEVMTGFGRTGELFAFEHLSYSPDIMCLSKGLTGGSLPLSLTVATESIYNQFLSQNKEKMFFHGHSFTGNPISCAAALANLEIIKTTDVKKNWQRISKIHQERINVFSQKNYIQDTRIIGTIAAIEFKNVQMGYTSKFSENITQYNLKRGVFLRPLGNIVYIMPPYSISNSELNKVWDVIEEFSVENFEK